MTTVTLRPDATIAAGTVTGAASTHAALNDDSDASYVVTTTAFRVHVDSTTLAGAVTKQWRARIRHLDAGAPKNVVIYVGSARNPGDEGYVPVFSGYFGSPDGTVTETGTWAAVTLTQAQVDALRVEVVAESTGRTHELFVDLMLVAQPSVSVDAVSPDPYVGTNLVPISWTNTLDSDGGGQTRYELRVFTAAQYGVGGFDPADSPATHSTAEVVSSGSTAILGAMPNASDHRAYVRVAQTVNGVQHWSDWDYVEFGVNVATSDVDTVTVVPNDATGALEVTVTRDTGSEAWDLIEVQASTDAGASWSDVRGATYVDCTADADEFVVTDYDARNGVDALYQARATRILSGQPITGEWVQSAAPESWASTLTFLKVPGSPTLNATFRIRQAPDPSYGRRVGVFEVLPAPGQAVGRRVVVSSALQQSTGQMVAQCQNAAESAALLNILRQPFALVDAPPEYQFPVGYVAITNAQQQRIIRPAEFTITRWTLTFVEIDAPPDPLAGR